MSRGFTSSIVCPHQIIHELSPLRLNPNKKEKPDNVVPEPGFHFPFSVTFFHEKKIMNKGVRCKGGQEAERNDLFSN